MEENTKKRSRKTKLVPRQYLDSDDENIAVMQQEIEAELANLKAQSLLKKLSSSSSQHKTEQQFSVKVEIEEYDEELTDEEIFPSTYNDPVPEKDEKAIALKPTIANPENSITKTECADIETVKNCQELLKDWQSDREDEVVQDINIRIESVRSLQNVDKIEVTCYKMTKLMIKKEFEIFSKTTVSYADKLLEIYIRNYFGQDISEVKLNKTEMKIQEALTKWGAWMNCNPLVRDTPLMYICYICRMAWWYLRDLKEHIKYHSKFSITLCTQDHISYVVATNNLKMGDCGVPIEGNCWRCGKDVLHHRRKFFKCEGCGKCFQTCLLLSVHEGDCEGNRKFYQRASKDTYLIFKCPVCPWKHWREDELLRHKIELHSVRSDLPVPLIPKKCGKCKKFINNYNAHDCIAKCLKESCEFCFRKFQSKSNLLLHYWVSPNNYFECRVCGKLLKKDCVEFEHLLEHTDNYKKLYMCLVCKDSLCFFDLHSVKTHTTKCHINTDKANDYCTVVVPKSLLQIAEPMKVFVPVPDENDSTPEDQDVNTAFQGLLGYLNEKVAQKTSQKNETENKKNKDIENNIQVTIINKNTVQKIMNSVESNEIPDIIKNIKKENTDDINDGNKTTLQAHNYNNSLHVNKNNDALDKKLITYSRTKSKKRLQSTDVGEGIKEYVTMDVPKIKEEPMDIDEINGINEINDIDLIDNNKNNEMNNVILNSVLQHIDDINFPIKLEIKEESDDMYEDDIILSNENVLNSTKSCKKLPKTRKEDNNSKKNLMEKYMWMVHNPESRYSCTKCNTTYISFKLYLMHFIKHDYEPLTCPKCMKPTNSEQQFWSHVNYHIKSSFIRVHTIGSDSSDQSNFQCKKCHQVLSYGDFFKHWEGHLDIQSVDVTTQFSVNMDGKPKLKEMLTNPENSITKTECADIETVKNCQELLKDWQSDREDEVVQDINIRIESVRSLQNVDKIEVTCYKMTKLMIKKEFEIFSKTTVSYADKLLEIYIRNYFGQDISEVKLNKTEMKIQEALTKWGAWMNCNPLVRDTPLMYICYICRMVWWYLHDLKEHIKYHSKFSITLCTQDHISYVVATNNLKMGDCGVPIEGNCWRCGKDVLHHRRKSFECDGCGKSFQTCLLLSMHEGDCEGNRKFYQKASKDTYLEFKCPVCPWKRWKDDELLRHQIGLHSVRSDLPVPLIPKKCGKCKKSINNYNAHDCIAKSLKESCEFCFRKFQSKSNLFLHYCVSSNNYFECRVCGKLLKKDCVEFEHLLEHTDNYKKLYMCLVCKDSLCFFDLHSVKNHTTKCHHINKEKTNEDYCTVVVPKSLLQSLEPMKVFVPVPEENDETCDDQDVDTAFQGLLGYLNKNAVQNTPQNNKTVNKKNIDVENNIQITIINKNTVPQIMNSVESNEIPHIIKNVEKENTEDINDGNKTTLQAHNNNNNSLDVDKNNDGLDKKLNTYSQTKSKKKIQPTDVGDGIKECVTTDVPKIKEEPMDIDEINGINEINDIDLISHNKNNDININNEMNNVILNSVLQHIDDINLPNKLEIKEESDDMYEDDIILSNENVPNSSKSCKKLPKTRKDYNISKKKLMEKYMRMVQYKQYNPESRYSCTKCNTTYISFKKYLMHFVKHDYEPLTCPKCMKPMNSEQQFWSHVNYHIESSFIRVHTIGSDSLDHSNFQCKKCHQVLSYGDFFKHWEGHLDIQSVDVTTQLSANIDGKTNLKETIIHLRDPEKISLAQWKARSCYECEKRFERKNDFKRHFIEHLLKDAMTERYRYGCLKCQICGHEFNSCDRYKRHLRDHASLPVYKCELCDKAFSDSSNFSKHKKVHNLSVVVCQICKKKFQKKEYLIKHLEMHEVTKPIECKTCNKIFYSQSVYSKHLKKNRPRFKCSLCATSYDNLKEKWDHMWEVHKERKDKADCPFCDNSYRKYSDVKKHIRNDHNNAYHKFYNKSGKTLSKAKSDDEIDVE